ncbi:Ku protein [Nocardiopsis sp. NPDC050513]|uniref:non-homologous end joining protein Ku n=1 Tax=Nocardiopsis sp. NPDC050513 TaxID=3364338 RepID=UPI0037AFC7F1
MASTVWKGTLSVGLLSLGVALYSARERHGPVMHQFVAGTGHRVRYRRVDEETGDEVAPGDIVKGAQVDGGDDYVMIEPDELRDIAPGRSRTLEIDAFVPEDAVDPLWYATTYYLGPQDRSAAKPYRLLCAALENRGRLGLARMVMRDREHLVLIGAQQGVLTAATLYWHDEIRAPEDVLPAVPEADLAERDLELAGQLVDAMAAEWEPQEYEDVYQRRLEELIDAKAQGRTVSYGPEPAPSTGTVVELTDALRESLKERRRRRRGGGAPKPRREATAEEPTKKELLERARELDVPGRSAMTKRELAEAVARGSSA